jgi:DNA repair exonuclease SbcCD ATPase subunit
MTNSVQAQENAVPTDVGSAALSPEAMALRLEVTARLTQFSDDLHQLMAVGKVNMSVDCMYGIPKSVVTTLEQRMQSLNQEYNRLDVKWNTYYQAQQMDIANSEDLMTMVASIEELKQAVKDTLDSKTEAVEAIAKFAAADNFIISQVAVYKKLYQRAYKLSLVKNLAPQLEKAKARESLIFEKLQASYDAAKASAELVPTLQPRMNVLDEQFVVMKSVSEKVQALEYKPIFQRIKDYVMGLAAVSIILLFFTMVVARYKAYKDKLANMKKMKEMMNNQGKDSKYPMI